MTDSKTLRLNGVGRAVDDGEPMHRRVLELHFNREPTDDELRAVHEYMRGFPDEQGAELETLLREARNWVLGCYPSSPEQAEERESMIHRIDAAVPPLPQPAPPALQYCEKDNGQCCRLKDHEGECDDIPF